MAETGSRRYAARAAAIAPSGAGHPAGAIMFGSGDAYPESLPDVAELARIAATTLFVDPGDAIVVTRSTYQSALGIFGSWEIEAAERIYKVVVTAELRRRLSTP